MPNPFVQPGEWLRGNLHTHTTNSDGGLSPQETVRRYAALEHDFLALTDHDRFTDPEGLEWEGMIPIRGTEVVIAGVGPLGQGMHTVALGIEQVPVWEEGLSLGAAAAALGRQCDLWYVGHPSWSLLEAAQLLGCEGYVGVEVYNGIGDRHTARGFSEPQWDVLLAHGRRVWGLAVDDTHEPGAIGHGWVVVKCPERSEAAVLEGLREGHFYSTCGPQLQQISVEGDSLLIECSGCVQAAVLAAAEGVGCTTALRPALARPFTQARLPLPGNPAWLRVEVTDAAGKKAWSNAFRPEEL